MSSTPVLSLACILFPNVQPMDFLGPLDLIGGLAPPNPDSPRPIDGELPVHVRVTYLAETRKPLQMRGGLCVVPELTYDEADKDGRAFDILLIPGGQGARPWLESNSRAQKFIKKHAPAAKYILTVCTGSWLLASVGGLDGKRATTNKSAFRGCVADTKKSHPTVEWIAKARWVVDGNIWTSSGVTAGLDLASAFIDHLLGEGNEKLGEKIRGILEYTPKDEGDDEWAEYYGLA